MYRNNSINHNGDKNRKYIVLNTVLRTCIMEGQWKNSRTELRSDSREKILDTAIGGNSRKVSGKHTRSEPLTEQLC